VQRPVDPTAVPAVEADNQEWTTAKSQIRSWAVAIIFAIAARAVIAESRWIPSPSMEPGLAIGDRLIVEKVTPWLSTPGRGDIVVFRPIWFHTEPTWLQRLGMADDGALIKRVVALPGERVAIVDGRVVVNGRPLAEPYASVADADVPELTVPAGHLYVMGDNRNHSADSRAFGPVPMDHLIGRAVWRFWPVDRLGTP
jgi:signal peptidase I